MKHNGKFELVFAGRTRHTAFRSLLCIAVALQPRPYKMLISPEAAT
jgi:hypothetical protein